MPHSVQLLAPLMLLDLPAGQLKQALSPVSFANCPGPHNWQAVADGAPDVDLLSSATHDDANKRNCCKAHPLSHCSHFEAPAALCQ